MSNNEITQTVENVLGISLKTLKSYEKLTENLRIFKINLGKSYDASKIRPQVSW